MTTEMWLRVLVIKLRAAGLPEDYVQRTVCELGDHADQCEVNDDQADKLVDTPVGDLANSFVAGYRNARWYRKMPAFVWVMLPIPLGFAVCMAFYCSFLAILQIVRGDSDASSLVGNEMLAVLWMYYAGKLMTPLLAVFALQKIVSSIGRPAWVGVAATAVLMLFFMAISTNFRVPTSYQSGQFLISVSDETFRDTALIGWSIMQAGVVMLAVTVDRLRRATNPLV